MKKEEVNVSVVSTELMGLLSAIGVNQSEALRLAEIINRGKGGREVALAITKLQEAKHWLHDAITEIMR